MDYGMALGLLHQFVGMLLYPVLIALSLALLWTLWELGMAVAETVHTLPHLMAQHSPGEDADERVRRFRTYANRRLESADLLARSGPILGLMGTLIPLGPGLTALGTGNIDILATALTVAFDTTVVGLLVGLVAYGLGRCRRRWYERAWHTLVESSEMANAT